MEQILISIITPSYNSDRFIEDTYHALLRQSYKNWEWLVTDDCSNDKTLDILNVLAKSDSRVKVVKNNINSGAAISRNNSLSRATGEYIAFIDSDDIWIDNKLELQLNFMIKEGITFSFTGYSVMDEQGVFSGKSIDITSEIKKFSYDDMLFKKATLGCSTVMIEKRIIANSLMPDLRTGQDYAFWLSILKQGYFAYLLPFRGTHYRIVDGSISRNKFKKAARQWEIYRKVEKLNFPKATLCFISYALRAYFR